MNKKTLLLTLGLTLGLTLNNAQANTLAVYSAVNGHITMDVEKTNGGGGTYQCLTFRECYIKVLQAEERGAAQYCERITIKRNGRVVWWRTYD